MTDQKYPLSFKLLLCALTVLLSFGVCEIAARIMFPRPPDDTRQPQIVYQYDPEIGYVLAPSQQGWSNDGFMTVNSLGFRGHEVALPKPAGSFRVVVIGDSVAAGLGVANEQTFSAQLEHMLHERMPLRRFDVVNLAVSGYNTRQEVQLLARHVERLQPDLVLVGFYVNDIEGSLDDGMTTEGGTRITAVKPRPGEILHMDVSGGAWWNRWLRRSRVAYLFGRVLIRWTKRGEWATSRFALEQVMLQGKDSAEIERGWKNVEKAFESLKALAGSDFRVGVISLPCKEQVTGQYSGAAYERRLRDIAQRLGFLFIDPLPALTARSKSAELYVPYDRNHENAAGHQVIAGAILDSLVDNNALQPEPGTASDTFRR